MLARPLAAREGIAHLGRDPEPEQRQQDPGGEAQPLGDEEVEGQHHEADTHHLPVDEAPEQLQPVVQGEGEDLAALIENALYPRQPGVVIEDPHPDGQRQPVAEAPQPRPGQGKDQEGSKHQVDQGVEVEISPPEQGELGKKIDIPATQAVPVQLGRIGIRNVSGHRR